MFGLKGDPLNLNTDESLISNPDDRLDWEIGKARIEGGKKDKLSEIGMVRSRSWVTRQLPRLFLSHE